MIVLSTFSPRTMNLCLDNVVLIKILCPKGAHDKCTIFRVIGELFQEKYGKIMCVLLLKHVKIYVFLVVNKHFIHLGW